MKYAMLRSWAVAMVMAASVGSVACSSSDSGAAAPAVVTTHVAAASGATVSTADGAAKLTIPAGALGADTDISLAVLPASAGSLSPIYDFGPDGTTFSVPATLTIAVDSSLVPSGKTLAIGVISDGVLVELAGSAYASGLVTAPVPHFTEFGVIARDFATNADGGADAAGDAGADACVACFMGLCPAETAACLASAPCADRLAMMGQCTSYGVTTGGRTFTESVDACGPDFATPICHDFEGGVCPGDGIVSCLHGLPGGSQSDCLSSCVWN